MNRASWETLHLRNDANILASSCSEFINESFWIFYNVKKIEAHKLSLRRYRYGNATLKCALDLFEGTIPYITSAFKLIVHFPLFIYFRLLKKIQSSVRINSIFRNVLVIRNMLLISSKIASCR